MVLGAIPPFPGHLPHGIPVSQRGLPSPPPRSAVERCLWGARAVPRRWQRLRDRTCSVERGQPAPPQPPQPPPQGGAATLTGQSWARRPRCGAEAGTG